MNLPEAPLVLPPAGDPSLLELRKKVRLKALRWLLTAPLLGISPQLSRRIFALRAGLEERLRSRPGPVLAAVGGPDVLPALLSMEAGMVDPADWIPRIAPNLLAGMARKVDGTLLWDWPVPALMDEGGRWIQLDPPARALLLHRGGVELRMSDASLSDSRSLPYQEPLHPLIPGLCLSEFDSNPLSMMEAHPDKSGNALSLGGRPASEWVGALREALALIQLALPEWMAELPAAVSRLVPVGFEPEKHLSASYREAPGIAYLTLHPDPVTLAEAVVHEAQHNKLNLLYLLEPVLENGATTWTPSPVRPDLRPINGVLLAVHAFVPVAALHARLAALDHPLSRTPHFQRRRRDVLGSNARGLAILADKAQPTPAGARLLADLIALHQLLLAEQGAAPDPAAELQ